MCAGFISSIPFEMANVDTMPEQINANFKAVRDYALNCLRIALTLSYREKITSDANNLFSANDRASRVQTTRYCYSRHSIPSKRVSGRPIEERDNNFPGLVCMAF